MYTNQYNSSDEVKFGKHLVIWSIALLSILSVGGFIVSRTVSTIDTAIIRYEEFQEIYNTCQKINTDLGTVRAVPAEDRMFESFSKAAVVAQKKQQLSRWVEEYNAKSRMWNRSLWKSSALPYELSVNSFSNFDEVR